MAINTLAAATIFQQQLDKIAVQDAVTGWMDANAGQVKYNGGAEVKIPKMSVQGMGDYDRDNGYQQGSVTLEYETRKMTQDRGRKFQIDPMDVDESNFIPTAAAIMAEFQRTQVIPEIDAYRISKIASEVITANKAGMVEYNYTPGGTGTSALRKVKEGIKAVRSSYNGPLVIHATPDFLMELELELAGKIRDTTFSQGGINTTVRSDYSNTYKQNVHCHYCIRWKNRRSGSRRIYKRIKGERYQFPGNSKNNPNCNYKTGYYAYL